MLAFRKALGRAATGAMRFALRVQADTLCAGRSPARRGLVLVGSLAPAAGPLSSGRSLQLRSSPKLPRGGWPAFPAPRPPQSAWAAGAPLPWSSRSPRAAAPRVLPVGLVSRGITSTTSLHARKAGQTDDAKWNTRLEELRLIAAGNGGVVHVSQGYPELKLGAWCNNQ
ncbi:hypothetical protein T484DRAFT_2317421, partial [Baffinella frigidus]